MKIELNNSGIRDLLRSDAVEDELLRRAERIADHANQTAPGHSATAIKGYNRALARVTAESQEARVAEAVDRNLTRALDAGR